MQQSSAKPHQRSTAYNRHSPYSLPQPQNSAAFHE